MRDDVKKSLIICITIIISFAISFYARSILVGLGLIDIREISLGFNLSVSYLCWLIPSFFTLLIISRFDIGLALRSLGLGANLLKGIAFAFSTTLPMLIGFFLISGKADLSHPSEIIRGAILPGFMEEYLFRGYLLGQLYANGRMGFIPAVLISALPFGLGHLYQGYSIVSSLTVFLLTAAGAIWFSWLYIEWDRNLWLIIFLHIFMNMWWTVFSVGQNAIGSGPANIFRFATIIITIFITVYRANRVGFKIGKATLAVFPQEA